MAGYAALLVLFLVRDAGITPSGEVWEEGDGALIHLSYQPNMVSPALVARLVETLDGLLTAGVATTTA